MCIHTSLYSIHENGSNGNQISQITILSLKTKYTSQSHIAQCGHKRTVVQGYKEANTHIIT